MDSKIPKKGTFLGIPYDWRRPTKARMVSRMWNPSGPFIGPRWYGWGYDLNFYPLIHPLKWRRNRHSGNYSELK